MPRVDQLPKLLYVAPYPPPFAGPEMITKMFLESSLQAGFEIILLKTNVRKSNADKGRLGITLILAFLRFVFMLIVVINRHRPQVVFYPVTATQLGWLGRDMWCIQICRMFRVKIVLHNLCSHFRLNYDEFHPIAQRLVRRSCGSVSGVTVQSSDLIGLFRGLIPNERIHVLPSGIVTSELEDVDLGHCERGKILFSGHLSEAKGYIDVLRCMEGVIDECPDAHFYFTGTLLRHERNVFFNQFSGERLGQEDPSIMRDMIQAGPLSEHYHELGMVTNDELMDHMRGAECFVLPSYSEGFSTSILEAMSLGRAVVCTPVGAHPSFLTHEEHCLMCEPGDVEKLTENIVRVLSESDLRARIARTNYDYVREKFDIEVVARRLSEILRMSLACDG